MSTIEKLTADAEKLGFSGAELRHFMQEQLLIEREEKR